MESKVQPVIKVEKIFPGGAASTNEALKVRHSLAFERVHTVLHQKQVLLEL